MRFLNTIVCLGLVFALNPTGIDTVQAEQNSTVQFLSDADVPAQRWAEANPDGMAISIRLGDSTPVTPETIERALRSDFREHGVRKLRFFWERGGNRGSSVFFHTRVHVWGPFGLANSRAQVAESAAQFLFEVERGIN